MLVEKIFSVVSGNSSTAKEPIIKRLVHLSLNQPLYALKDAAVLLFLISQQDTVDHCDIAGGDDSVAVLVAIYYAACIVIEDEVVEGSHV